MIFDRQPVLEDHLVTLRPLQEFDRMALFKVASDTKIWEQHHVKERATKKGFDKFFDDSIASGGALLVLDRKSGEIAGSSRFQLVENHEDKIEIGWSFLGRKFWGGTYNGAVKRLMIDYALQFVDVVIFFIRKDNLRSQRAVEKIGGSLLDKEVRNTLGAKAQRDLVYGIFHIDRPQ